MPDDPMCTSKEFWVLWWSKFFKNIVSMKFTWLFLLYVPIVYGMFQGKWVDGFWIAKIPPVTGCALLGGGFITLAVSRVYAKTKLRENGSAENKDPMSDD